MAPTTLANTNTLVNNAVNNGNALQAQDNAQVTQNQGQYNNAYGQANNAYGQLQNFTQNLPGEYSQLTNQYAQGAGYNPQTMQNTMNNAQTLSETMANLPNTVNQMGNYSGATGGQIAQNYANMAPNIAGAQAGANTMLQNQQNAYAMGLQGAQNVTGQQGTDYSNLYAQANQQMATAAQAMNQIEQLAQTQGTATADQVASYQNAYSTYVQAQAAANLATQQAAQTQQTVSNISSLQSQMQVIYGPNWAQALADVQKGVQPPQSLLVSQPKTAAAPKTTTTKTAPATSTLNNGSNYSGTIMPRTNP